ncbi:MAG: ABC transporter substrate-binding protein [Nitrospiraceae bacterium]
MILDQVPGARTQSGEVAPQPAKVARIGYLSSRSGPSQIDEAFDQCLQEFGRVNGQTIAIEYRWGERRTDRLPDLAAELVRLKVDVLFADSIPAALAAKNATKTIPVVFAVGGHPVSTGLVPSLARPGGNITGTALIFLDVGVKRLELIKEALPGVSRVAVLWNPTQPAQGTLLKEIQGAASSLRVQVHPLDARGPKDFEDVFSWMTRWRPGALFVLDDPMLVEHRRRVVDFALQQGLPTISGLRVFVHAGGLMAYGPDLADMFRRAALYIGKILQGAHPADLPVERSTRFELVINLKTAKSLCLDIPESVLARADEVIH